MTAVVVVFGLCVALGVGCQRGTRSDLPAGSSGPAGKVASTQGIGGAPQPAIVGGAPQPAIVGGAPRPAEAAGLDVAMGMPAPSAVPAEPAHVTLPRSPSTRVGRTTRPLTRKQLERLSAIEHKDFDRQDRGTGDDVTEFRHTTVSRPKLGVTIKIEPCTVSVRDPRTGRVRPGKRRKPAAPDPRACVPMRLDVWKAKGDELKQHLGSELAARPDTKFEIGTRKLAGITAIYTYQLGHFFGKDDRGQPVGAYSDAYILYYNDGVNRIQVIASYLDDAVDKERLLAIAPPEDLEKLAVAFMSFYLHRWR